MGALYVRVDDRLIHGQIVTAWSGALAIGEIIAIDEELAKNPMLQSIATMGVPVQLKPRIVTVAQAKEILKEPSEKNRLLITKICCVLSWLREEIKEAKHINLGNCSKLDDSIYKMASGQGRFVYLGESDKQTLDLFESDGVPVICQLLPSDKVRTWENMKANI